MGLCFWPRPRLHFRLIHFAMANAKKPIEIAKTPGPEAERLKIDMDWEDAAARVMKVKKPDGGWPTGPAKVKKKAKKRGA